MGGRCCCRPLPRSWHAQPPDNPGNNPFTQSDCGTNQPPPQIFFSLILGLTILNQVINQTLGGHALKSTCPKSDRNLTLALEGNILWIPWFFSCWWIPGSIRWGLGVVCPRVAFARSLTSVPFPGGWHYCRDVTGAGRQFVTGCALTNRCPASRFSTCRAVAGPDPPVLPSVEGLQTESFIAVFACVVLGARCERTTTDVRSPVLRIPLIAAKYRAIAGLPFFCIPCTATGSGCVTGTPNVVSLAFASPP